MKEEKKLNKAEEVKTEESGVKLTDEELEQVNAGAYNPDVAKRMIAIAGTNVEIDTKFLG